MRTILLFFSLAIFWLLHSQEATQVNAPLFQPLLLQEQAFKACIKKFLHDKHFTDQELATFDFVVQQKPTSFFKGIQIVKVCNLTKNLFDNLKKESETNRLEGRIANFSMVKNPFSITLSHTDLKKYDITK